MMKKINIILIGVLLLLVPGCLILEITPELDNPFIITFTGVMEDLPLGEEMEITANITDENGIDVIPDSYEWYLDGELIPDQNGDTIWIGNTLELGVYWLDLIVTKDSILSSDRVIFEVTP